MDLPEKHGIVQLTPIDTPAARDLQLDNAGEGAASHSPTPPTNSPPLRPDGEAFPMVLLAAYQRE